MILVGRMIVGMTVPGVRVVFKCLMHRPRRTGRDKQHCHDREQGDEPLEPAH